jgi:hypothetical protein
LVRITGIRRARVLAAIALLTVSSARAMLSLRCIRPAALADARDVSSLHCARPVTRLPCGVQRFGTPHSWTCRAVQTGMDAIFPEALKTLKDADPEVFALVQAEKKRQWCVLTGVSPLYMFGVCLNVALLHTSMAPRGACPFQLAARSTPQEHAARHGDRPIPARPHRRHPVSTSSIMCFACSASRTSRPLLPRALERLP